MSGRSGGAAGRGLSEEELIKRERLKALYKPVISGSKRYSSKPEGEIPEGFVKLPENYETPDLTLDNVYFPNIRSLAEENLNLTDENFDLNKKRDEAEKERDTATQARKNVEKQRDDCLTQKESINRSTRQKLNELKNFFKGKLTQVGEKIKEIPDDDPDLNNIDDFNVEDVQDCKEEENIGECANRVIGYTMNVVNQYKKKARDTVGLEKLVADDIKEKAGRVDEAEATARAAQATEAQAQAAREEAQAQVVAAQAVAQAEIASKNLATVQKQAAIDNGKRYLMGIKEIIKGKLTQDGNIKNPTDDNVENINDFNINDVECNPEDDITLCGPKIKTYVEDVVKKYRAKVKGVINETQNQNRILLRDRDASREQARLESERAERAERIQIQSQEGLIENENARARAEARARVAEERVAEETGKKEQLQTDKEILYENFKRILTPPRRAGGAAGQEQGGTFPKFEDLDFQNLDEKINQYAPPPENVAAENVAGKIQRIQGKIDTYVAQLRVNRDPIFSEPDNITDREIKEDFYKTEQADPKLNRDDLTNFKFQKLYDFSGNLIKRNEIVYNILKGKALKAELEKRNAGNITRGRLQEQEQQLQIEIENLEREKQKLRADIEDERRILIANQGRLGGQFSVNKQNLEALQEAEQRIQQLETEIAKKSIGYKTKEFLSTNVSEPIKSYFKDEDFTKSSKIILFIVISLCIILIILGIYFMVKMINSSKAVNKNKDKNDNILNKIIKN